VYRCSEQFAAIGFRAVGRLLPEVPGVEHRYVDAGGLRVHVAEAGAGDPLILQHGWPQNWFGWRKLIPELAKHYRVIAPDLRGHGWTDAPPRGYDKEQLASDLLALMDALELERARVVAHDWGGFAAFLAALRAPERFERFGCLSVTTPWLNLGFSPKAFAATIYQPIISMPVLGPLIVRFTPFTKLLLAGGSGWSKPWSRKERAVFVDQWREADRARATSQVYRTFLTQDLPAIRKGAYRDKRLTVPTLLLYGDKDPVVTKERIGDWESRADQMEVRRLSGAHFLPDEVPDVLLEHLLPFLR
jgi:pimeloyl-ACP methyl ester carboxylesterase